MTSLCGMPTKIRVALCRNVRCDWQRLNELICTFLIAVLLDDLSIDCHADALEQDCDEMKRHHVQYICRWQGFWARSECDEKLSYIQGENTHCKYYGFSFQSKHRFPQFLFLVRWILTCADKQMSFSSFFPVDDMATELGKLPKRSSESIRLFCIDAFYLLFTDQGQIDFTRSASTYRLSMTRSQW